MSVSVQHLCRRAQRPAEDLTRRDVVLGLLDVSPHAGLAALGELRTQLPAGCFSEIFWARSEEVLTAVVDRAATSGQVRAWLHASGTEPTAIPGLHAWDDEADRTPLAHRLHGELVAHLEGLVAAGEVDPDALLLEDGAALQRLRDAQAAWLLQPGSSGTSRVDALFAEDYRRVVASWTSADRAAGAQLEALMAAGRRRTRPEDALREVVEVLIECWQDDPLLAMLCASAAQDSDDPAGFWLCLASGVIRPSEEAPAASDPADVLAWYALEHVDWLAVVEALVRGGVGLPCAPEALAGHCVGVAAAAGEAMDGRQRAVLERAFVVPVRIWRTLGALDSETRLTELGLWGIPESVAACWAHD
jgi:hypothetical protein